MRTTATDINGIEYTQPTNTVSDNNSYLIQINPINSQTIDVSQLRFIVLSRASVADASTEFDVFNSFNENIIVQDNELLSTQSVKSNNYSKKFGLGYEVRGIRNPTFAPNYPIRIYR
jgi:hypothetical protein